MLADQLETPRSDKVLAGCGVASVVLLAAALRWAHHWNPVADTIVFVWAIATLGAVVLGMRLLGQNTISRLAWFGLALGLVSVASLVIAGIAFAMGADPAGACGGA